MNYYNENDPKAAAWLRELIKANLIAQGEVDERSIEDIRPADLAPYTQCHFFAGIGGWSYALRLAGWPDDKAVWTGSCPCQPFSSAGKHLGTADARHLWPVWHRLIVACKPGVIFGEQVSQVSTVGRLCDAHDYLQSMPRGKELLGVSHAWIPKEIQRNMQVLSEHAGEETTIVEKLTNSAAPPRMEGSKSGFSTGIFGTLPSAGEKSPFQHNHEMGSGKNRSRSVRTNSNSISTAEHMGNPLLRSKESKTGVYEREHTGSSPMFEHYDEYLGFRESLRNRESDRKEGRINDTPGKVSLATRKDSSTWIDIVFADLEDSGYSCAAADLCAASVGAPHIRQRLYFVADTRYEQRRRGPSETSNGQGSPRIESERFRIASELADSASGNTRAERQQRSGQHGLQPEGSEARSMVNTASEQMGVPGCAWEPRGANFWSDCDWIDCQDGKQRPVEPGTFPLVDGLSGRLGLLRGYGNAIVPQVAAEFIKAYMSL